MSVSTTADQTITAYRAAAERGDADAVTPLLAEDVAFHSPMTDRITFAGRAEVTELHRDIFAVLEDLTTSEPLVRGNVRSWSFQARVRGVDLSAHVVASVNASGLVEEVTIFVRPLPALAALFATLPPRVSARRRGRLTGAVALVATRPLALAVGGADRFTPRFL
jgi:hypothetical protein